MSDQIHDRLDELEEIIQGQDISKPGILMRMDRQERQLTIMVEIVKYMVFGGGAMALWKIGEFFITMRIGAKP